MKHTLKTIIWVIAMTLGVCASAQTDTKRAFRMYMHDGSVQFFFYSDIQSMTVGYEAGDMERPVQIINTPDSVYTFAMADIDSVSFARPVTEYKSNVVRLEDGLLPYVIACDSLTLTFRSDVPRNLLPPVGTPLFTFESNEILPSGFMGELVALREEGNVIAECSSVDITDVFDNLFFAMGEKQTFAPNDDKRRTQWIHDGDIHVEDMDFRLPENEWEPISIGLAQLAGSYEQTAGYNLSTSNFHARVFILCENGEASFSFTSTGKHKLTLDASAAVNIAINDDLPLVSLSIPIPNCPMFDLGFNFGLCYSFGSGFAYDFKSEIPFTSVLHFSGGIKDVGNHWGAATNNIANTGRLIFDRPTTHYIAEGMPTAEIGIYGSIDIHPSLWKIVHKKDRLALSAGLRTGWRFNTEMPQDFSYVSPIEEANAEFYDILNGKDVYKLQQFLSGFIKLEEGFTDLSLEYPWDFHVWDPVWSFGIVPEFKNVSLEETENKGTLRANATLSRKIATYVEKGFALYDDDKNLVEQWWESGYYIDQEGSIMTHDFCNLKPGVKYVVHPLVRIYNTDMVANPSASNQIEPSIYTQVAKNITPSSATLTALITQVPEYRNFKAGFVYYDTPDNKKTVVVDNNTANVIADISGLKESTNYSYYAFLQIGDYTEYGEILTFKTKEKVGVNLNSFGISNIDVNYVSENLYKDNSGNIYYGVDYELNITMNLNSDSLKYVDKYGYYIVYGDHAELHYNPNDKTFNLINLRTNPIVKDVRHTLNVRREQFAMNYESFNAECSKYKIGAFLILSDGSEYFFDEREIKGLTYNKKPSIEFSSPKIEYAGITALEGMFWHSVDYEFYVEYKGALWIDSIVETTILTGIFGEDIEYDDEPRRISDKKFVKTGRKGLYTEDDDGSEQMDLKGGFFNKITLCNGMIFKSKNKIRFGGTYANPLIWLEDIPE